MQTILLLKSAFLCVFRFFGLSSFDTVTTLILSRLVSFHPFFEVIPEIFHNFFNMNRTYLTRAIRELAGVYGYTIHIDTDDRTPREIVLLPAAWLPPIRLKEVEGRLHGRATYSVELRLLHPGAKLSSERRNEVWSQTELQLFDLFTQLSTDPKVIAVENLTVQPGSGAYTPHGEISQTAKADVITCF